MTRVSLREYAAVQRARYQRATRGEKHQPAGRGVRALSAGPQDQAGLRRRFHSNLRNALAQQGKPAAAIEHYWRALTIKPDYAEAHNNLGVTRALSRASPFLSPSKGGEGLR